ncbi:MAG: alkaline phosphatase family protein [Burkholderiaceae bacterium]
MAQVKAVTLPTGQAITPTLPPASTFSPLNPGLAAHPDHTVSQAISEALSPDGKTLAVLTTGYNKFSDPATGKPAADLQSEFVFLYDVSSGTPVQKQVLQVANTWAGITFSPDGTSLYVAGGVDDSVHSFSLVGGTWTEGSTVIKLGHAKGVGPEGIKPVAAGLSISADGTRLVVANLYNDSVSIVDLKKAVVEREVDLRPGKSGGTSGAPGGTYPFWVSIKGNATAYVSSLRDREVVLVDLATGLVQSRIALAGNPNKMIFDRLQSRLFVAMDNTDSVAVFDTANNKVLGTISTVAPAATMTQAKAYGGAAPDSLALSSDENTLYVTNNGTNSVAVIALNQAAPAVVGLIPTGWSPQAVVYSAAAGGMLYVANSKSVPGPNTGNCLGYQTGCPTKNTPIKQGYNQYILQLSKAGLQAMPAPASASVLAQLTAQVAKNNSFNYAADAAEAQTMGFLESKIKHVIYIVRENRTYDQVLGDLGKGNGDPSLTEFGKDTTPNQHALANQLVTLDAFFDPAEVSGNGWPWSTAARESDFGVKMLPPNYANRGGSYEWEGANRNVGMGNTGAARLAVNPTAPADPDFLPGTGNVAAPDGPTGEKQQGYLWNAALRANLSVRNYGFFVQNTPTRDRTPFVSNVAQAASIDPDLVSRTDPFFRGYDNGYPEFYRQVEWEREFNQFVTNGNLPALSLVRFGTDHTGSYATALDGVNTPELQVASNDYAIGKLIEAVAKSPYAADTLVFIVEDDCQDGPDHVDEHRSIAYVAGPYVKQGAVVSTRYSTVNMLRTIEDILGTDHLSIHDHNQGPMTDVFDVSKAGWSFTASVPAMLRTTALPLPAPVGAIAQHKSRPRHDARYWIAATRGMDFRKEDQVDAAAYNRVLWRGIMGNKPYPAARSGIDMSKQGRAAASVMSTLR